VQTWPQYNRFLDGASALGMKEQGIGSIVLYLQKEYLGNDSQKIRHQAKQPQSGQCLQAYCDLITSRSCRTALGICRGVVLPNPKMNP
jgi:hypothetical protein